MTQQVKSIIERILRLKEEQDALSSDIRDVYAEAKSNGHDKTAIGQAVALIRKKEKDPQKFDELDSMTEIYLAAYYGGTEVADISTGAHPHEADRVAA